MILKEKIVKNKKCFGSLEITLSFFNKFFIKAISSFSKQLSKFTLRVEIGQKMSIGLINTDLIQILKDGPILFMILIEEKETIFRKKLDSQINNIPLGDISINLMKKIKLRVIFLAV
ncbi:hypothetical protein CM15mP43_12510 [bacterium]|nr:MAG: hypothetical protein CM15mP43_12510 [bacterium]